MSNEIYEFEISRNAEGGILATAGVKGEGTSYRIAGPKAWGGSKRLAAIDISQRDMVEFIRCYAPAALAELCAPVASAAPTDELPPLPDPVIAGSVMHPELKICYVAPVHFTADQMRAYARAAIAAQQSTPKLPENYELESQAFGKLLARVAEFGFEGGHDAHLIDHIKAWGNGMYVRGYDKRKTEEPDAVPKTALTNEQIIAVWQAMPGGPHGFLKNFGYIQFARAILEADPGVAPRVVMSDARIAELAKEHGIDTGDSVKFAYALVEAYPPADVGLVHALQEVATVIKGTAYTKVIDALAAAGVTKPKEDNATN